MARESAVAADNDGAIGTIGKPKKKPEKTPEQMRSEFVEKFHTEYAKSLAECRVSASLTDEEGWQNLYRQRVEQYQAARVELADRLRELAEYLAGKGLTEDGEKEIGEVKKSAVELREAWDLFMSQTVKPIKDCVDECNRLIANILDNAGAEQVRAPLVWHGLLDYVTSEVNALPKAMWDGATGRVSVS